MRVASLTAISRMKVHGPWAQVASVLAMLALSFVCSQAQTPFQDAKGNGSILLSDGGSSSKSILPILQSGSVTCMNSHPSVGVLALT